MNFIRELIGFLRERNKLWLLPVIALTLAIGLFLIFTSQTIVAPFVYTLF